MEKTVGVECQSGGETVKKPYTRGARGLEHIEGI